MKPYKITGRNIMFSQPMTQDYDLNLGLILGARNNYIIDTGLGDGSVAPILDYIGDDGKPIVVINTHSHWDHVWGNWVFEDSLIISHITCREFFDKRWDEDLRENTEYIDGHVYKCLPNMVFKEYLYLPEDDIRIIHTPGHTIDCISVYDAVDKVLYAGDNIGDTEDDIVPWIDTDMDTFQRLIETYRQYDFKFCISGHNKPQDRTVLARMESNLADAWKKQNENTGP